MAFFYFQHRSHTYIFLLCSIASSVRVSNELGRGSAKSAKFAIKVATLNSSILGCFFLVLFLIIGKRISYLFTDSEEVAKYVSDMRALLVLSVVPCILQPILSGQWCAISTQTPNSAIASCDQSLPDMITRCSDWCWLSKCCGLCELGVLLHHRLPFGDHSRIQDPLACQGETSNRQTRK